MAALLALTVSVPSQADLADFIIDLYGGDGIRLPPALDIPQDIAQAHVPHFTGEQQIEQLAALSNGLLSGMGVFALNSTVTGVTFDLSQGVPVSTQDSLGPLLAERATTIGDGRLTFGFGYSRQKFDELDGNDLSETEVVLFHQDCCQAGPPPVPPPDDQHTGFELDTIRLMIDIDIEQEVFAFFGNYGLTDRWDVGVVVPVVSVEARAFSEAEILLAEPDGGSTFGGNPVHSFEQDPSAAFSETGGKETGLGDVILRSKYQLASSDTTGFDFSVLGQVTFPTGDEDELLGTGETKFRGMLIASKTMGRYTPHANVAYEVATSNSDLENLTYAVGFDARVTDRITGAIDVLGRYHPHLDEIGNHIVDLAFAVKFNPFSNFNAPINAFVSVPLNDDGLRADMIWGIGFDIILD
ncbi:MAG TPA: transporter [Pseudomonadales bacterium]